MPEVEYAVATIHPSGLTNDKGIFSVGNNHVEGTSLFAGKDLFNVFSYKLLQGNKSQALANLNAVILSDEMAMKLFHTTANVIGRSVDLNLQGFNGLYTVYRCFSKASGNCTLDQFDVIFNYDLYLQKNPKLTNWGNNNDPGYLFDF